METHGIGASPTPEYDSSFTTSQGLTKEDLKGITAEDKAHQVGPQILNNPTALSSSPRSLTGRAKNRDQLMEWGRQAQQNIASSIQGRRDARESTQFAMSEFEDDLEIPAMGETSFVEGRPESTRQERVGEGPLKRPPPPSSLPTPPPGEAVAPPSAEVKPSPLKEEPIGEVKARGKTSPKPRVSLSAFEDVDRLTQDVFKTLGK